MKLLLPDFVNFMFQLNIFSRFSHQYGTLLGFIMNLQPLTADCLDICLLIGLLMIF